MVVKPFEIDNEKRLMCGLFEMMLAITAISKGTGSANKKVAPMAIGVVEILSNLTLPTFVPKLQSVLFNKAPNEKIKNGNIKKINVSNGFFRLPLMKSLNKLIQLSALKIHITLDFK